MDCFLLGGLTLCMRVILKNWSILFLWCWGVEFTVIYAVQLNDHEVKIFLGLSLSEKIFWIKTSTIVIRPLTKDRKIHKQFESLDIIGKGRRGSEILAWSNFQYWVSHQCNQRALTEEKLIAAVCVPASNESQVLLGIRDCKLCEVSYHKHTWDRPGEFCAHAPSPTHPQNVYLAAGA